ncbi:hypothetical protein NJ7G_2999 [Natrinema sp. J7-2]|nr:hypothetical protein NJ7G_2999 [Natrinema sp. J7-2]
MRAVCESLELIRSMSPQLAGWRRWQSSQSVNGSHRGVAGDTPGKRADTAVSHSGDVGRGIEIRRSPSSSERPSQRRSTGICA